MAEYIIQKAIDRKDMSKRALDSMGAKRYLLQPKFDGCAMVVVLDASGMLLLSSTGEPVRSCDHIGQELAHRLQNYVREFGPVLVIGEVWHPAWDFPTISGKFRSHSKQDGLMFCPFDLVRLGDKTPDTAVDERPYSTRIIPLMALTQAGYLKTDHLRNQPIEYDPDTYAKLLKDWGGFDGAILRDADAPYKVGRCRNAEVVKVKPLLELDLRVIGVQVGVGEKTGKHTASLKVDLGSDNYCFVSTGLTQANVDEIATHPNRWIGQIIAVEAMGYTKDGALREPRFKGVRYDKLLPDL